MKTNLLSSDKDPMGAAIADYFNHRNADKLRVFSSQFEEDEIPVLQSAAVMNWPCKRWV